MHEKALVGEINCKIFMKFGAIKIIAAGFMVGINICWKRKNQLATICNQLISD